jgi:hypothetical protein
MPVRYNGVLVDISPEQQTALAQDVLVQLSGMFAPAHTQFAIGQLVDDQFGQALVSGLRKQGYAVHEAIPAAQVAQAQASEIVYLEMLQSLDLLGIDDAKNLNCATPPRIVLGSAPAQGGVSLRYIVDEIGEIALYRIVIDVDARRISRLYRQSPVQPATAWTLGGV